MATGHVCPVWVGHILTNPLRKLWHPPQAILEPYIESHMQVLDLGCALGYFSLPMARMVGEYGKVICVDVQKRMLDKLEKRARRARLHERMHFHLCSAESLALEDFNEQIDFALAFAVLHEIPDPENVLAECFELIRPGGTLLLTEPKAHVTKQAFRETVSLVENNGFDIMKRPHIKGTYSLAFRRASMPGMVVSTGN